MPGRARCACFGRWRLVCLADMASHMVLRWRYLRSLCDFHNLRLLASDNECVGKLLAISRRGPHGVTAPPEG